MLAALCGIDVTPSCGHPPASRGQVDTRITQGRGGLGGGVGCPLYGLRCQAVSLLPPERLQREA